jgi:hypothetical protein
MSDVNNLLKQCFAYQKQRVHILADNTVNINGDVRMLAKLDKIPVKFGKVREFNCIEKGLTSLENSPKLAIRFLANKNQITSTIGCPTAEVIDLRYNIITDLSGICLTAKKLSLTYHKNLPILRLLLMPNTIIYIENNVVTKTVLKYRDELATLGIKATILKCQKELINKGFIENAAL